MTLYDDLGVPPDATPETIHSAWRGRAKSLHPDAGGDQKEFQRVQSAYLTLRDPAKRAHYDRTGETTDIRDPDADALSMIAEALATILTQGEYHPEQNLLDIMIRHIDESRSMPQSKLDIVERAEKRAVEIQSRTTNSKKKTNKINALLTFQLNKIRADITTLKHVITTIDRAIEILRDHTYTPADPPPTVKRNDPNTFTFATRVDSSWFR